MKNSEKFLLILLIIVLSISLLAACQSKTSYAPAGEDPTETNGAEKPGEQPQGEQKSPEEPAQQEQIATEASGQTSPDTPVGAPAQSKPAQAEKSSEQTPSNTENASKPKQDDETSLQIEGTGIENTIILSLDEMKAMQDAYYEADFFSLNSYGTKEYFHFKGVRLKAVLDKAKLKSNAKNLKFVASDGYAQEITMEQALREDYIDEQDPEKKYPVIIAWHENGKDYDPQKGAPFRLVIGQKEPGDVNKPQWVQNIAKIIVD